MKRNFFIASIATVVAASVPSLVRAKGPLHHTIAVANTGVPGWPNPEWTCKSAVVWLDSAHGVYYRKGESRYAFTEQGAYSCEDHANKTGHRAA